MKKLKYINLFEEFNKNIVCKISINTIENENYYDDTSWEMVIDGKKVKIKIQEIKKYLDKNNIPIIKIPVKDIFHMCIHKDKKDEETLKKSEESNLDYPIIISKNTEGKYTMILDGHHRLLKANNNNFDKIKARILDLSKSPKEYKKMFS